MAFSQPLIWFFVGVAFLVAELFFPGFILIFFTAGSWVVGLSLLLFDIGLSSQILVFIVVSLILLFALRKYSIKTFKGDTAKEVDDAYAESKIGKTAIVTKKITPKVPGEVKMMGSYWRAVSDMTIEEGESVVVEQKDSEDGLTFRVKLL